MPAAYGSEQWAAERAGYIGASDVPAILGLSPWAGPWTIWARKTGRLAPQPQTRAMRLGLAAEPMILAELEIELDAPTRPDQRQLTHPEEPRLRCHLDGWADLTGGAVPIEVKRVHPAKIGEWRSAERGEWRGTVAAYWAQVQTQLAVVGEREAILAALAANDLVVLRVQADPDAQAEILRAARAILRAIDRDEAPEPTAADNAALGIAYDGGAEQPEEPPALDAAPLAYALEQLDEARAEIKASKARATAAEAKIKAALGDLHEATIHGRRVTWRPVESRRIDTSRLRAEHPEIVREFETVTRARKFLVRG